MKMNSPKVYVPHYLPRFDYSALRDFGDAVPITERAYSFNADSPGQETLRTEMRAAAAAFDQHNDYLVLSGVALNTTYFVQLLAGLGIKRVRCLVWSTNDGSYTAGVYEVPA